MLVIIKSSPDALGARSAVELAEKMSADIVLLQDGIYLTEQNRLEGFSGTTHVLSEDLKMRGVESISEDIKAIGYEELIDLMAANDKVMGMF
jgi:sulfur relay protein TusB/DsrH